MDMFKKILFNNIFFVNSSYGMDFYQEKLLKKKKNKVGVGKNDDKNIECKFI